MEGFSMSKRNIIGIGVAVLAVAWYVFRPEFIIRQQDSE
jgi:hypothetical protein